MAELQDLQETILGAWNTNNRITLFLVENLPKNVWTFTVPGAPRRTVGMVAGHIHNARCMWIKTLGAPHGIKVPASVPRQRVTAKQLVSALRQSGIGMARLLKFGLENGGHIPPTRTYVWRNLPLDVGHVLGYFIAHEGHHRGQIVMIARAHGERLPAEVTNGLWQWTKRSSEP